MLTMLIALALYPLQEHVAPPVDYAMIIDCYSLAIPANAMTVTTNTVTVTTDNRSCSECARTCGDSLVWDGHKLRLHLGECDRNVPPTERYETTTITEVKRLTLMWLGERRELVKETVLSNVTVKYVLKPPEWEKVRTDCAVKP